MSDTAYLKKLSCNIFIKRPPYLSIEDISAFYQWRWNCIIVEYAAHSVLNGLPGKGCHFGVGPREGPLCSETATLAGPFCPRPHRTEQRQQRLLLEPQARPASRPQEARTGARQRAEARGPRPEARACSAGLENRHTRRRAPGLRPRGPPAAVFPSPGAVAKATAAERSRGGPRPPSNRTGARRSPDSLCSAAISGPGREAAPLRQRARAPEASGMVWDRVGGGCAAPDSPEGGNWGRLFASCLTAAGRRRRRLIGASLAVWSPAAAAARFWAQQLLAQAFLGIRTGAGGGSSGCPRLGPVAPEGWQEEGLRLRELTEPRRLRAPAQLLPRGFWAPSGAAPDARSLSRARTHHRLHTPTADRCLQAAFFPLGDSWFHDMFT